ncbi:MAG: hypothetical protein LUD15_01970 [Bacteroides sp.]|nr:hypothetical protein [Bacteroides sp.]
MIGEPVFDKVEDFAMQFWSDGAGKVCFKGYSFFMTDGKGAYVGNMLLAGEQIEAWLAGYVGKRNLRLLQQEILPLLSAEIGPYYKGPFGVDMMICRFNEKPLFRILPCVEVNLRMNMGMFTRTFYDRFVHPGHSGEFFIDSFKDTTQLTSLHRRSKERYPLRVEQGKITGGYLSLTPVTPGFRFRAWIVAR